MLRHHSDDRRLFRTIEGHFVNITRGDDGMLRPNLKRMPVDMSVDNHAFEVFRELRHALKGLVEE